MVQISDCASHAYKRISLATECYISFESSGMMDVALSYGLDTILQQPKYFNQVSVGFSGIISALAVLTTQHTKVYGMIVPSDPTYYINMVVSNFVNPNVHNLGHTAGFLVGVLYKNGLLTVLFDMYKNASTSVRKLLH
eukprot:TRINITY_DN9388_c0_g1_i1.p1 TRINITY_DN9388_c0_g1~~TRINITY_DN9388_c0_g1_i1.p1  ORF type:complete len:138 (-),score=19.88 TRINITY_DN9388_c0_g1_i1:270-683(-)